MLCVCCVWCRLSERLIWMGAMFIIAFGFFVLIPMGDEYPSITAEGQPETCLLCQTVLLVCVYVCVCVCVCV